MDEKMNRQLDQALDALAEEVRAASPLPGPDLMARVLADAADHTAAAPAPAPVRPERRGGLWDFGWLGGTVAAMAVALLIGMGIGLQMDTADLPLLAAAETGEMMLSDGGFLPEEIL